ncbi:MAG TPA: heparinase II/III family protein [Edaphobacter sp.]
MLLRGAALAMVLWHSGVVAAHAEQARALAPYRYASDFAERARDGWESFPLAQDSGYDPTLNPGRDGDTAVLVREVQPLRDGKLAAGLVHRFHFTTQSDATIRFRYRVPFAHAGVKVRVTVFRGAASEQMVRDGSAVAWQSVELKLPARDGAVTGLAFEVMVDDASVGRTERVEIADVAITASAPPILRLKSDGLLWDSARELYYERRAVLKGHSLTFELPCAAQWNVVAPDDSVKMHGEGAAVAWQSKKNDPAGIWKLHASCGTGEASVLFLVRSADEQHGLLFDAPPAVSPELLKLVRERRAELSKTVHAELGMNIARLDERWLLPGLPSYFALLVPPSELALLDAVEFRASADRKALEESRAILRSMAEWPMWVHPWFKANGYGSYYPVGIAAGNVAVTMEYLGVELSAKDRTAMEGALLEKVVKPVYTEYVDEDRISFNTSNWIGNTVGGAMLAAASFQSEESAGYLIGLYRKEYEHVRASYMRDGSYGEGVSYEKFDLGMTTLVAALAKRHLGSSMDDLLVGSEMNLRYTAYSNHEVIDYGDTHPSLGPSNVFAYLASLNKSPNLTKYYLANRATGTQELLSRLLWENGIHAATGGVDEPESKVFVDRGVAVLRDGWSELPNVAAIRAGPNFNHTHADEGSVTVAADGEIWLGEAGYADYYKDPSYQTYVTQAAGHNTLLIDGNWESQQLPGNRDIGASPRIEQSYLGRQADVVNADLTSAYGDQLQGYERTLVSLKHGALLVIDRVRASQAHRYAVLWHPLQTVTSESAAQGSFVMGRQQTNKAVRVIGDGQVEMTHFEAPLPLSSYVVAETKAIERPVVMQFSTVAPQQEATFVSVVGDADAANDLRWSAVGRSLKAGFGAVDLLNDGGLAISLKDKGLVFLKLTEYSRDGISIHATTAISGELIASGADGGELIVDAVSAGDVRLEGLVAAGGELHVKPGRNVFKVRLATVGR